MAVTPLPLSCFIIARNEADRIGRTIASVKGLAAEVVVIDSGSSDGTQQVAERAGARVIFNAWPGFGQQKRFGEMQCANEWLLNLDADEVVPEDLAHEIRSLFAAGPPPLAGYWMDDLVVYPGHQKPRWLARDHHFLRLYDRRRMRFADSTLFDNVHPGDQQTGKLQAALHHFSVRSMSDLIAKCDERASYNAANTRKRPRWQLVARVITEFPMQFLKYYLWRTHIFGGLAGFQFAMITAFYRFVRIVRMLEGAKAPAEMNAPKRRPGGEPVGSA
jgi:glycosyltransferase involved in cell wall biosynthesis